jgi:hypothetical protein
MELVKALPLGAILTFVVALLIGSQGSTSGGRGHCSSREPGWPGES